MKTIGLCQWEPFQFERTHVNMIAEACEGMQRQMIFGNVSVQTPPQKRLGMAE